MEILKRMLFKVLIGERVLRYLERVMEKFIRKAGEVWKREGDDL